MSETTMQKKRADEAQIVQKAQQGDPQAFAELFDRWNEPLLRYLYHTLGNGQEAEDLAQEAFLRAYQRLEQLGPPWDFKSWLYRIATNLTMDHLQRDKRYVNVEDPDEAVEMELPSGSLPVERQVERLEQHQQVWEALGSLPTLYRQALVLRELHGLSYEEIREALDCSFENARQLVHRARLRFRDQYGFSVAVLAGGVHCRVLGDLLSAYHDGELSAQARRDVEQHLKTCPECRETQQQMGMIAALLLGLPAFHPSSGWADKVRARLRDEAQKNPRVRRGNNRPGYGLSRTIAGLGIGGLVLAVVIAAAVFVGAPPFGRGGGGAAAPVDAPPATAPRIVSPTQTAALAGILSTQIGSTATPPQLTSTSQPVSTPSPTLAPSATPTQGPVNVSFNQNANCRKGPGAVYNIVTSMAQGQQTQADGRNAQTSWLDILIPNTQVTCWVIAQSVDPGGPLDTLPVLPPPPLPPAPANFNRQVECQPKQKTLSVKLTWSVVPGVTGYHIYRNGTLITTLAGQAGSYVDSSGLLAQTLTYEIEAFNANGASDRAQTTVPPCK